MANILVYVTEGVPEKDYEVPSEPMVVTQAGCRYAPHVFGMRAGQKIKFLNPDGILHNVNGQPTKNQPFNKAMPKNMTEMEVEMTEPEGPFSLSCSLHPWMRSFCAVFDHPFFDVTETDGVFTIEGLEPGEYTIEAWHEKLGTQTAKVTIPADGDATQDFAFEMGRR